MRRRALNRACSLGESNDIYSVAAAMLIASGVWLLILVSVFLRIGRQEQPHNVVSPVAVAASHWPDRYRKYALYHVQRIEYRRSARQPGLQGAAEDASH